MGLKGQVARKGRGSVLSENPRFDSRPDLARPLEPELYYSRPPKWTSLAAKRRS